MSAQSFDWGLPDVGEVAPSDIGAAIQSELRNSQVTAFVTPQSADKDAQTSTGLGIQNIKRAFLNLVIPYDPSVAGIDFQTSATSFEDVSQELSGSVVTSGRPVAIYLRGSSTGDAATFTVRIDKEEATGISYGVMTSAMGTGVWFAQPDAGRHTFAMQWKVASGTAVMPRSHRPYITVVEI